jgi:hypothetical protein
MSHPPVHPMDVEPAVLMEQPHGVQVNDMSGKPGTPGGLSLHSMLFVFSVIT